MTTLLDSLQPDVRKKIVRYGLLALGVVLLVWLIVFIFSHSWLVVTTEGDATVTVYNERTEVASGKSSPYNTIVSGGEYSIKAEQDGKESIRYVSLPAAKRTEVSVGLIAKKEPVVVTNATLSDVVIGNPTLLFGFGDNKKGYVTIDENGAATSAQDYTALDNFSWAQDGFGAGIVSGEGTEHTPLGIIENGQLRLITTNSDASEPYSATTTDNHTVWFAANNTLYKLEPSSDTLSSVYTASNEIRVLTANETGVIFMEGNGSITAGETRYKIGMFFTNSKTVSFAEREFTPIESPDYELKASSSPSGKYTVVTDTASGTIFDSELKSEQQLPTAIDATAPVWLSDNELVYSTGNNLWLFNIGTQTANLFSSLPTGSIVKKVSVNRQDQIVYATATTSSSYDSLYKVSLKESLTQTEIDTKLSSVLPTEELLDFCQINYVHLTKVSVVMFVLRQDSDTLTAENAANCRQSTISLLESTGVDPNSVVLSTVLTDVMGEIDNSEL